MFCFLTSLYKILKANKIYRKYLMCQNILYYWHYYQKTNCNLLWSFQLLLWESWRFYDRELIGYLGSHFIFLSNIYKSYLRKNKNSFAHKWLYPSYAQNRKFLNSDRGIALAVVAISRYICMFKIFTIPPALGTSLA